MNSTYAGLNRQVGSQMSVIFTSHQQYVHSSHIGAFTSRAIMMVQDGVEKFVINWNRKVSEAAYPSDNTLLSVNFATEQLTNNNGAWFKLHGKELCPITLLKWVKSKRYNFDMADSNSLFKPSKNGDFVDFEGNLKEISSAFKYRIYDHKMIEKIKLLL